MTCVAVYTELVHDARAKLILLAACVGIFCSTQNIGHPYDDRQTGLLNRVEESGLMVRLMVQRTIQVLLFVHSGPLIVLVCAASSIGLDGSFVVSTCTLVLTAVTGGAVGDRTWTVVGDLVSEDAAGLSHGMCVKETAETCTARLINIAKHVHVVVSRQRTRRSTRATTSPSLV